MTPNIEHPDDKLKLETPLTKTQLRQRREDIRNGKLVAPPRDELPDVVEGVDEPPRDAPEGDAPEGDAPEGDAPEGDAPEGDAPEGDAPEGDESLLSEFE